MQYRYPAVIPPDFDSAMRERRESFPVAVRFSLKENEKDCVEGNVEKKSTYSRSMTAAGILLFIAGAGAVFAQINMPAPADPQEAKQQAFAVFPIFGAVLVSAGICLLHNVREGKEKIAGRVIFALLAGVVGPFIAEFLYPPIVNKISDIRLQLGLGVVFGGAGYIFSRAVVEKFFKVAPEVADVTVSHVTRKYTPQSSQPEKRDP